MGPREAYCPPGPLTPAIPLPDTGFPEGEMAGAFSAVGRSVENIGNVGVPRLSGIGSPSASATAAVSDAALGKRVAGSFARLRITTIVKDGGILGLMSSGEVGCVLRCCEITSTGVSPRKGVTPVTIS